LLQARVHLPSSEPKATSRLGPKGTFIALPWAEPKSIIVLVKPPENELALTPEGTVPGPLIMVRAKEPNASRIILGAVSDFDSEPPAAEVYDFPDCHSCLLWVFQFFGLYELHNRQ
jgi:hypothetical protein